MWLLLLSILASSSADSSTDACGQISRLRLEIPALHVKHYNIETSPNASSHLHSFCHSLSLDVCHIGMDSWFTAGTVDHAQNQNVRLFAQAAEASKKLQDTPQHASTFMNNIWASRVAAYLELLAMPLAFWFKPVCVCLALFW